jgi:cytochrome c5
MLPEGGFGSLLLCVIVALPTPVIAADETDIVLAEGPGREQVQAACSMCHSLDYIVMNSPFQDKAAWEKSVRKMVTVMGAPLTAGDVAAIVAYLDGHYGKQPAADAPH